MQFNNYTWAGFLHFTSWSSSIVLHKTTMSSKTVARSRIPWPNNKGRCFGRSICTVYLNRIIWMLNRHYKIGTWILLLKDTLLCYFDGKKELFDLTQTTMFSYHLEKLQPIVIPNDWLKMQSLDRTPGRI